MMPQIGADPAPRHLGRFGSWARARETGADLGAGGVVTPKLRALGGVPRRSRLSRVVPKPGGGGGSCQTLQGPHPQFPLAPAWAPACMHACMHACLPGAAPTPRPACGPLSITAAGLGVRVGWNEVGWGLSSSSSSNDDDGGGQRPGPGSRGASRPARPGGQTTQRRDGGLGGSLREKSKLQGIGSSRPVDRRGPATRPGRGSRSVSARSPPRPNPIVPPGPGLGLASPPARTKFGAGRAAPPNPGCCRPPRPAAPPPRPGMMRLCCGRRAGPPRSRKTPVRLYHHPRVAERLVRAAARDGYVGIWLRDSPAACFGGSWRVGWVGGCGGGEAGPRVPKSRWSPRPWF